MPAFARGVLYAAPRRSPILVVGKRGRPYEGESGFRANFFCFVRELDAAELVNRGLTFHGLRTSMATWAKDAGAGLEGRMARIPRLSRTSQLCAVVFPQWS